MHRCLPLALLAACVTTADSPVTQAITGYCAAPVVSARLADEDGLPPLYDEAVHAWEPDGPVRGRAVRMVEAGLADGLDAALPARFGGDAPCTLDVAVENVILPDATRHTLLSGQKSFLVTGRLRAPDGTVLAETARPFTILAEHQSGGRRGAGWSRLGRTDALRVDALVLLTGESARVLADAFGGGRTQTGLAGRLVAHPARVPGP